MSAKSQVTFDITPEKEASQANWLYRQLFVYPPAISRRDVHLAGKTAIVTGSNIGLGLECARQLLDLGIEKLILAVRDEAKGAAARETLRTASKAIIEVWKLDLSHYDSVTAFTERAKTLPRLDFVVLNAGVFKVTFDQNPDTHHEEVIQVNYLSTALLTILMLPVIQSKNTSEAPGRLVLLLGQLFMVELVKRVPPSVAIINACNPGLCHGSGLHHETTSSVAGYIFATIKRIIGRSTQIGARVLTDAAVNHGEESHGQYLGDGKLKPFSPIIYKPEGQKLAEVLWQETMDELSFAGVDGILKSFSR
ncbi:NAD(P)-binding protein [Hypoxylon argillaceum]|nr:NAD(P)-binding protein [Hypoxylon argillaceum]